MCAMKSNIRIVLVNTSHPGNIGAVARAMKNMCLERLYLVEPNGFPSAEATARASGADDLLAEAVVCRSLDEALEGCQLVMGASARDRRLSWPVMNPRECAVRVTEESAEHEAALVFGREHSGLTNEELEKCHYLVHIPSNPHYSSLNLGAAVQVLAYELMMTEPTQGSRIEEEARELATADEMESFFQHLEQVMVDVQFLDASHPRKLMRRMRRLFNRARPDRTEINILRGMFSAAQGSKKQGAKF